MLIKVREKKKKKNKEFNEKEKKKKKGGGGFRPPPQYKSNLLFCALVQAVYTWDIHTAVRELCISDTSIELKH